MKTRFAQPILLLALLAGSAGLLAPVPGRAAAVAPAADGQPEYDKRLASTAAMAAALARESAKAGIDNGALLGQIAARTKEAETLAADGKFAAARAPLDDAYRLAKTAIAGMQKPSDLKTGSAALEASQHLKNGALPTDAARSIYARRKESVIALLATGRRIASEKGRPVAELAQAEGLLKEADALAAGAQFGSGRTQLDRAYLLARDAVRGLRGGEELRADKNFAGVADEYRYEQARNDDYQDLIAGVVDGRADPSWAQAAEKARGQRHEAETIAASGDIASALRKIEESTGQLKSILRRAGFPIM